MDIADAAYNWLVEYFSGRSHCTRYGCSTSTLLNISASIVQGSAIGPVSFVINAADLTTATPRNLVHKYADDTYVVIPACNVQSRADELEHVALWAQANNLKLNRAKTVEVIFTDSRRKLQPCRPPELPDIRRATSIRMLGVTLINHLSVSDYVRDVISRCA